MLSLSKPQVDLSKPRAHNARWIGRPDAIRERRRFRLDRVGAVIGKGTEDFQRAAAALMRWEMAHQPWLVIEPDPPDVRPGAAVAVVARAWPLWTASIGLITAVEESATRLSIAYGTTHDHVAMGEERFEVIHHDNGDVVFSIVAVSRPARWWVWLGYPVLRAFQARFRRGAVRAMRRSVKAPRRQA